MSENALGLRDRDDVGARKKGSNCKKELHRGGDLEKDKRYDSGQRGEVERDG